MITVKTGDSLIEEKGNHMAVQSDLTPHEILHKLKDNIATVIRGQEKTIKLLLTSFASGGHILLEDCPGTGKTTLAKTLAKSIDCDYKRVQFTPDLLPSDIVGLSIFDQKDSTFKLHKGPVFTNILLVDEINRTSPRTQSALLEAMAEKQVSIDGSLHKLEHLFFVIATQNPIESHGTYPLPEAQMDRFAMLLSLGYVSLEDEVQILFAQDNHHPIKDVKPCVSVDDILFLKEKVKEVHISDELRHYIVKLVQETRSADGVVLGASPRASISIMKAAKAVALFEGRDYLIPEDIHDVAVPVIAHRIILDPQAKFSGITRQQVVEQVLASVEVPS